MARDMAEQAGVHAAGAGAESPVHQGEPSSTPERPALRALRHALWIGLLPALWLLFGSRIATFGTDSAHAYWNVWRVGPYTLPPGSPDAFNYSPAFAQLLRPLTLLPWPVFLVVWSLLLTAALVWLLWPLSPRWRWLMLGYIVAPAVLIGNIEAFLAVSAVVGLRYPVAWAFPLLTKVTPGLGPVWFAVRREWRSAGWAVLSTAVIVAVSYAIAPSLWADWLAFLSSTPTPSTQDHYPPLWLRLPLALAVVVWGARRNRPASLAVAMVLAMPLWSSGVLLLLAAVPRLRRATLAAGDSARPTKQPG
jgi:hypothetical protein